MTRSENRIVLLCYQFVRKNNSFNAPCTHDTSNDLRLVVGTSKVNPHTLYDIRHTKLDSHSMFSGLKCLPNQGSLKEHAMDLKSPSYRPHAKNGLKTYTNAAFLV